MVPLDQNQLIGDRPDDIDLAEFQTLFDYEVSPSEVTQLLSKGETFKHEFVQIRIVPDETAVEWSTASAANMMESMSLHTPTRILSVTKPATTTTEYTFKFTVMKIVGGPGRLASRLSLRYVPSAGVWFHLSVDHANRRPEENASAVFATVDILVASYDAGLD